MDGSVAAALIGAAVFGVGWLMTDQRDRRVERARRRSQIADIQRALLAEISAHVHQLEVNRLEAHREDMLGRMRQDPGFVVLVPADTHETVYRSLLPDIHLLPGPTVGPVVLYYNQIIAIANLAADIRSDRYASISAERRAAIYGDYIEMKIVALRMGQDAIAALTRGIERATRGEPPAQ